MPSIVAGLAKVIYIPNKTDIYIYIYIYYVASIKVNNNVNVQTTCNRNV